MSQLYTNELRFVKKGEPPFLPRLKPWASWRDFCEQTTKKVSRYMQKRLTFLAKKGFAIDVTWQRKPELESLLAAAAAGMLPAEVTAPADDAPLIQ